MEATSSALQVQLLTLVQSAKALVARGQHDDAEQVFGKVLEIAPYHRDALNFMAARAYGRGDLQRCLVLLEKATRAQPDDPILLENLAIAYLESDKLTEALQGFDQLLSLRPGNADATLFKGHILDRQGLGEEALQQYAQACIAVGDPGPYLQSPLKSARMKDLLRRAISGVMGELRRLIEEGLLPLRSQYRGADFARVDACVEGFVTWNKARPDPLQRPSLLYFPGLPTKPFYERYEIPASTALENARETILAEYAGLQPNATFAPYVQAAEHANLQQWRELNQSRAWSAYHLYRAGDRLADACEACPETTQVIEALKLARIPGHAPEVFFSVLKPGTHIPPHFGLGNYKLAMHLPLVLPGNCAIRVGNETREWQEGECLIFDDSFQHEAWNRSEQPRAVLILDVWHPALEEHERASVCAILAAIGMFRQHFGLEFFKS